MRAQLRRLDRLEQAAGGRGQCICPNGFAVYYEGEPEPEPTCATCGGEKMVCRVVYEKERGPGRESRSENPRA